MQINDVQAFINQQLGISQWRQCEAPIKRLCCKTSHSFSHLLPPSLYETPDTPIFTCKFCPNKNNEKFLALANEDGKLTIHDTSNDMRYGIHAHNNAIFDLAWMFGKMKLITASGDHTSKMYDIEDGYIQQERVFYGHSRSVKTVAFRKDDSNIFASGGRDGNIILWDTRTNTRSFVGKVDGIISNSHVTRACTPSKYGKKFNTPSKSSVKSVTGLVFQEDNTLISCGAGDGVIKIWDLRKHYHNHKKEALPKWSIPYPGPTTKNGYSSLIIDNEGLRLYANCLDNTIYCYNVGKYNYEPVMQYRGHQNNTFFIKSSLSKEGKYLMSGSSDENAYIWDTKLSEPIVKLTGHVAEVTCVAWCNNGTILVTCSDDMTHKIWTVGLEELPEDWKLNYKGIAEVMPIKNRITKIKRHIPLDIDFTPKKFFTECQKCNNATSTKFCENCGKNFSKRKNSCELESANKIMQTDFGPRRLFANMNNPLHNEKNDILASNLDTEEQVMSDDEPPRKMSRLIEQDNLTVQETNQSPYLDCDDEPPIKFAKLEITPTRGKAPDLSSPTINLPNFVLDGTAPHLNYSPPKKKCQDWLTRIRVEKLLRKEYEKTDGATTPKQPRSESLAKRKCATPRSPILKYFKVTNSPHKCDGRCSKHQNCLTNVHSGLETK